MAGASSQSPAGTQRRGWREETILSVRVFQGLAPASRVRARRAAEGASGRAGASASALPIPSAGARGEPAERSAAGRHVPFGSIVINGRELSSAFLRCDVLWGAQKGLGLCFTHPETTEHVQRSVDLAQSASFPAT